MGFSTSERTENTATSMDKIRVWECREGKAYMLKAVICPTCPKEKTDNLTDNFFHIKELGCCLDCYIQKYMKIYAVTLQLESHNEQQTGI